MGALMIKKGGGILLGALDRIVCGPAHYWAAMFSDLAAGLAFLVLGLRRFSGSWTEAGGSVIVGFIAFGLLEYVVHRWLLHGRPSIARRGHMQHHADPRGLVGTPIFVITTFAMAVWGLVQLVVPSGLAALLVFGLYAGYNCSRSCTTGNTTVAGGFAGTLLATTRSALHLLHHRRQNVNFGVSTASGTVSSERFNH